VAHKRQMAADLTAYLSEFRARRAELNAHPGYAWEVLAGWCGAGASRGGGADGRGSRSDAPQSTCRITVAYTVKTHGFEGPFDLLLSLVARQKVDVQELSIAEIADQYLEYIEKLEELDLEVASDFLLVAATLLELKAASLLPRESAYVIRPGVR